jgi:hypothetical protein
VTSPSKSYERVHYEFRPCKQVERRMLVAALQRLMEIGFPISEYQYTGMGSIYFIDFILLHRYLGIDKMLSVEHSRTISKRVEFNKPFDAVDIGLGDIADFIPSLSADRRHLLWLDYDAVIDSGIVDAVSLAAINLSPESVLLVTVDVMPPDGEDAGPSEWKTSFLEQVG